jgi:hypothetical protein
LHETPEDLARLQGLLDRSFASAGDHLAGIFQPAERLSADALAERLTGIFEMHLAVTTSDGAPLVAPIDAQLFRGEVWFGLPAMSVRTPLVKRDGRVSASYTDGSFALIVHGVARAVEPGSPREEAYTAFVRDCYIAQYGPQWIQWHEALQAKTPPGGGFTGWIEPRRIYAKS